MGFGYLTVGYLFASLIYLTAQALHVGSLASLVGYLLMFYGLSTLQKYESGFAWARWGSLACVLLTGYDLLTDASNLFSFDLPILTGAFPTVMQWVSFTFKVCLLIVLLHAVQVLAREVGLSSIVTSVWRNLIVIGAYVILRLLCVLPFFGTATPYLRFAAMVFEFAMILLNLWLLLQCTKNICREGDEEVEHKPSRFAWVNRMTDAYEKAHDKLNEQARADGEAFRNKHIEKNQRKGHKRKKK